MIRFRSRLVPERIRFRFPTVATTPLSAREAPLAEEMEAREAGACARRRRGRNRAKIVVSYCYV